MKNRSFTEEQAEILAEKFTTAFLESKKITEDIYRVLEKYNANPIHMACAFLVLEEVICGDDMEKYQFIVDTCRQFVKEQLKNFNLHEKAQARDDVH